jgi:O-antigen/teichoic acid export membrane protein
MLYYLKQKINHFVSDQKFSKIIKGSAWALAARVIATVLVMCTNIIIARVYGVEVIGVLAMITSVLTLFTMFTKLGTGVSILRLIPEHIAKYSFTSAFCVYRKTKYFVAGVSVLSGGVLFFSSNLIAEYFFDKPYLSFYFALSAFFVLFLALMNLNSHAVRGLQMIRTFAVMQLMPALFNLLVLLGLMLFCFNTSNPVYAILAAYFVTALIGVLLMYRQFHKKMKPLDIVNDMPIKKIIAISFPMLMTSTMTFGIGQTGVIMLGIFRTEAEVGYYYIAVKLATLTTFILNAVNTMAAPKFSELFYRENMEELFYIAQKTSKLIFWTTVPILAGLVILGKLILGLVFGAEFTTAYEAMLILVIGQFINSISGSTGYFMNMTGNQNAFRNIIFGATILVFGLGLALIPLFGIVGAAFAGMMSMAFWNISTLLFIKRKYGKIIGYLPYFLKTLSLRQF